MTGNDLCVYEVVNAGMQEAVVGVTNTNRIEALRALHKKAPPVWITRWSSDHPISYTIVEGFSTLEAAREFTESYKRSGVERRLTVHVTGMTLLEPSPYSTKKRLK